MVDGYGEKLIKSLYTYTRTRAFTDVYTVLYFSKILYFQPEYSGAFPVLICNIENIKTLCVIIFPSLIFILLPVKQMYYF